MTYSRLKIGLFGIGLDAYWPQFEGLEARLCGYLAQLAEKLQRPGVDIVNVGLVDNPDRALAAGHELRQADVDLIFLYVTTYALSSTVLPVVQRAKVPVIILNLQPEAAIDYAAFNKLGDRTRMTGEWLAYCTACSVPEIGNLFRRAKIPFFQVTGVLEGDPEFWRELDEWIEAARVAHVLFHNRLGLMGRYYNGMLDIYTDLTRQCAAFGGHMEIVEIDELAALRREVTDAQTDAQVRAIYDEFDVQPDCDPDELRRAARTALALERLIEKHRLGSMAYYYESVPEHEHEDVISSVILGCSMMTARGVPIAGEYEIKNAQAMKIMDSFGAGGSFTEYYALDFKDDIVLMGHDGPGHIRIAEGKTKVRPLQVYHGKVGKGLSVEMSVKHGPVTLLSVVDDGDGAIKLLCAEAESAPGPLLEIGNTNSRYRFSIGVRAFVTAWNAAGPAHHCAVGVGHIASKIEKLAALLDLRYQKIC